MKKYWKYLIGIGIIISLTAGLIIFRNNKVLGTAVRYYMPSQGGTGTSSAPTYGQLLVGTSAGVYQLQATSTLGITATEAYTGTVTSIATTYPITGGPITTTGTLSLDFGTTTVNSWNSLQTFTYASTTALSGTNANFTNLYGNITGTGVSSLTYASTTALSGTNANFSGLITSGYGTITYASSTALTATNLFSTYASTTDISSTLGEFTRICFADGSCMSSPNVTGSLLVLFHHNTAAELVGYEQLLSYPPTGTEIDESCSADADVSGGYCDIETGGYISTTTDITLTSVRAGTWLFKKFSYTSNVAGLNKLESNVYKRSAAGVETYLFQATSSDFNLASVGSVDYEVVASAYTLLPTDRIVIKLKGWTDSSVARSIHQVYGSTARFSRIITPIQIVEQGLTKSFVDESITGKWTFSGIPTTINYASSTSWSSVYASSTTYFGGELSDCDTAASSKLLWSDTGKFSCGTESLAGAYTGTFDGIDFTNGTLAQNALWYGGAAEAPSELTIGTGGYILGVSSGAPAWIATTTIPLGGELGGTLSAATVSDLTDLTITYASSTSFSTAVASSTLYYGADLTDCDTAATSKLLWSDTGKFSCGTDSNTTYTAGDNLTLTGTDFDFDDPFSVAGGTITYASTTALSGTNITLAGSLTAANGTITYASSTAVSATNANYTTITATKGNLTYASSTAMDLSGYVISPKGTLTYASTTAISSVYASSTSASFGTLTLPVQSPFRIVELASFNISSSTMSTTTGSFRQIKVPNASTVTGVACDTNVGTSTIQCDVRNSATPNTAGTNILGTPGLLCGSGINQTASTTLNSTAITAFQTINCNIPDAAPVGGTKPSIIHIHIWGTKN